MVLEDTRLQQASLKAFVKEADNLRSQETPNQYPLASAYPLEEVEEIENVYNIVEQQINASASITGFNAGAPIKNKGQGKQAIASLTKIQNANFLDEIEMYHYRNPRNDAERQKIVDGVLMDTNELSVSVDDTVEYIRSQMAYNGRVDYLDPMTQTRLTFDLDRPEENNITVASEWGTDKATPVTDLQNAVKQFQKTNGRKKPEIINMNSTTYNKLISSGQIKRELFNDTNSPRIVKDEDVTALFNSVKLPQIVIDDTETAIENELGEIETHEHLEDDKVILRSSVLGSTMSGPSVENNFEKGKFVVTVIDKDPVTEKTIVGQVVMPVTKNVNGTVHLNVAPETTDGGTTDDSTADDGATA